MRKSAYINFAKVNYKSTIIFKREENANHDNFLNLDGLVDKNLTSPYMQCNPLMLTCCIN